MIKVKTKFSKAPKFFELDEPFNFRLTSCLK